MATLTQSRPVEGCNPTAEILKQVDKNQQKLKFTDT